MLGVEERRAVVKPDCEGEEKNLQHLKLSSESCAGS